MQLTDQNFKKEVEEANKLVLVDFFATWCGPCKLLVPIIEELIEEYKDKEIKIGKLDIDDNKEMAEKYNIMGIPTLILFKQGKIIEQVSGFQTKEDLKQLIDKNM